MRILTKLDIRNNKIVKGLNYEGVESKGEYYNVYKKINNYISNQVNSHFEIILNDVTASLYNINSGRVDICDILDNKIFSLPHIVSGGLKDINCVKYFLEKGTDRVMINTSLVENINIIDPIVKLYGSQIIIPTIEVKYIDNDYFIYTNYGREDTNIKLSQWILKLANKGIIEIFIISIDTDGLMKGYDKKLMRYLKKFLDKNKLNVSFLYGGGITNIDNTVKELEDKYNFIKGICISSLFYSNMDTIEYNVKKIEEKNTNNIYFLNYLEGNTFSVKNHFSKKYNCYLVDSIKNIPDTETVCIAGHYNSYKLIEDIENKNELALLRERIINKSIKYIGICAGFQILFDKIYDEFGKDFKMGIGILKSEDYKYIKLKFPNIGFKDVKGGLKFFCHSYMMKNKKTDNFLSQYVEDNIEGYQFHPENSL
jgi:imidazole glycerol-phosphate synthase subunit HisF